MTMPEPGADEPLMTDEQRDVLERIENAALVFRRRYGLADEDPWTDEQLDRALVDHGYPPIDSLPDTPQGPMLRVAPPGDHGPSRSWQRINAAHLLGHAISHGGGRCHGCETWGTP
jgi:hypothetical protein